LESTDEVKAASFIAALRLTEFLAATAILAWTVSACGSGTSAHKAAQAASTVASQAKSKVATVATKSDSTTTPKGTNTNPKQPATATSTATRTLTQPAQTKTVTQTSTASAPAQTTSISNRTTNVHATNVTHPPSSEAESSGGLPWWGWLLIALGAAVVAISMFRLGRRRGRGQDTGGGVSGEGVADASSPTASAPGATTAQGAATAPGRHNPS
jgi:cytoskeletal protein RodZ